MSMTKFWPATVVLACNLLLLACGGGGDGGGSSNTEPNVTINQTNGDQIAAQAVDSDDLASESSSFLTLSVDAQSATRDLTDIGRHLLGMTGYEQSGISIQDHYIQCNGGGSVDDSSAGQNSGSITFNDCIIDGVTFDGSVSYSGGSSAGSASFDYNNLFISDGTGFSVTIDGDMHVGVTNVDSTQTTTISGNRLTVTAEGEYVRLLNYELSDAYDGLTGTYTSQFDYVLDTSVIGGRVRVTTASAEGGEPLMRNEFDFYPYAGRVVAIGEGNTRVAVTVQGGGTYMDTVLIEYDEDGDGNYDAEKTLTWGELDALDSA